MLYRVRLVWAGFELTMLVVIGTDHIGSCKSNYMCHIYIYMLTTTKSPFFSWINVHNAILLLSLQRKKKESHWNWEWQCWSEPLFNAKWPILQLYHMARTSYRYIQWDNDVCFVLSQQTFIVLVHWNNSPWLNTSLHSDTVSWFHANLSLFLLLNAVCLTGEKQHGPIFAIGLTQPRLNLDFSCRYYSETCKCKFLLLV
jgi:hypothetical protein